MPSIHSTARRTSVGHRHRSHLKRASNSLRLQAPPAARRPVPSQAALNPEPSSSNTPYTNPGGIVDSNPVCTHPGIPSFDVPLSNTTSLIHSGYLPNLIGFLGDNSAGYTTQAFHSVEGSIPGYMSYPGTSAAYQTRQEVLQSASNSLRAPTLYAQSVRMSSVAPSMMESIREASVAPSRMDTDGEDGLSNISMETVTAEQIQRESLADLQALRSSVTRLQEAVDHLSILIRENGQHRL
ncbi:hypothetical protein EST38_g14683 [Candolleomyces aberdarensis]|uniref:Uncharacterized protein n=1 Tax=Candolleomyces aberdarensis TaxID=2316362 RepID=A0A4Q2CXT7_9AGAR|nr:hypothetical protein EST38_g14683 [Candolleomyces aberdarensis]